VFFPAGFDFVKGGKLPGLYGGRPGCSGGDPALDCFSTRLMWRTNGAGELYLYAARNKQGPSVCDTGPKSDCSTPYGLSIGRGSFHFAPGNWTNVKQTVVLNTPGLADGEFGLKVNGHSVMEVQDVYYRGEAQPVTPDSSLYPLVLDARNPKSSAVGSNGVVGFVGIFFSTFFGGHEADFATPEDQMTYFKDFEVIINA